MCRRAGNAADRAKVRDLRWHNLRRTDGCRLLKVKKWTMEMVGASTVPCLANSSPRGSTPIRADELRSVVLADDGPRQSEVLRRTLFKRPDLRVRVTAVLGHGCHWVKGMPASSSLVGTGTLPAHPGRSDRPCHPTVIYDRLRPRAARRIYVAAQPQRHQKPGSRISAETRLVARIGRVQTVPSQCRLICEPRALRAIRV